MAIDLTVEIDSTKIVNQFRGIRKAASDAISGISDDFNRIDDSVNEFAESIELGKRYVEELKRKYRETSDALERAPLGTKERALLRKELNDINRELEIEEEALRNAAAAQTANEQAYSSVRAQMTAVRNEMTALALAGQKDSARYKELQNELGKLGTAYRTVAFEQKALSTGATQWAGIQSGLQGVLGAFAVGQGIMGAFTSDTEKLVKVQTRLQSVMGIIMGMTQVSNTLHETSAFRMTTLTKVTEIWNAANQKVAAGLVKVGVSANVASVAAKALTASLTLGLSVAIGFAIAWINKLADNYKKTQKAAEEFAKTQKSLFDGYARSVASSSAGLIAKFNKLKEAYDALGDSLEAKEKYILENKNAFKDLGARVESVNDAENLFVKNAEAFKNSIMLKAKAAAGMKLAADTYEEAIKRMIKAENLGIEVSERETWLGGRKQVYSAKGLTDDQNKELNDIVSTKIRELKRARNIAMANGVDFSQLASDKEIIEEGFKAGEEYIEGIREGLKAEQDKLEAEAEMINAKIAEWKEEASKTLSGAGMDSGGKAASDNDRALALSRIALKIGRDKELASTDQWLKEQLESIRAAKERMKESLGSLDNETLEKFEEREENARQEALKKRCEINKKYNDAILDQDKELAEKIRTGAMNRKRLQEDNENMAEEARINAMGAGYAKTMAIRALENKKEIQQLERQKEDYIEQVVASEKAIFDAREEAKLKNAQKEGKSYEKQRFDTDSARAAVDTSAYDEAIARTLEKQANFTEANLDQLLEKYASYEDRKQLLLIQYLEESDALQAEYENTGDERFRRALEERRKAYQQAQASLEQEFNTADYQLIFGDHAKQSMETLAKAAEQIRAKIAQLGDDAAPETVKALYDQLNEIENLQMSNPFEGWTASIDGIIKQLHQIGRLKKKISELEGQGMTKEADAAKGQLEKSKSDLKKSLIATGVNEFANALASAADSMKEIAEMSGDVELGETADVLSGIAQNFSAAAQGAASGGWIGAIVGGVTDAIGQAVGAFTDLIAAEKKAEQAMRDYSKAIEGLSLTVNESDFESAFGKNEWRLLMERGEKAQANRRKLQEVEEEKREWRKHYVSKSERQLYHERLYDDRFGNYGIDKYGRWQMVNEVTQKAIGNEYIMSKGRKKKRTEGTLSNLFPDLFDEKGNLRLDKIDEAKTALTSLESMELKEGSAAVERFRNAIEYAENYLELQKEIEQQVSGILGDWAGGMGDAIVDWVMTGADAMMSFEDIAKNSIKNIAQQMARSLMFEKFNEYNDRMVKAFMSDDETEILDIIDEMAQELPGTIENSTKAVQAFLEKAKEMGYDISDLYGTTSAQTASARGFQAMSQDTGDELNGRFTDIQGKVTDIRDYVLRIMQGNETNLNEVINIRDIIIQMNGNVADIRTYTSVLPEMRDTMTRMNRKLEEM